jgi:hypothetical protein
VPSPLIIDPELYDDTELGSEVREAHANGVRVVVLMPMLCGTCHRSVRAEETCAVCGDEDQAA